MVINLEVLHKVIIMLESGGYKQGFYKLHPRDDNGKAGNCFCINGLFAEALGVKWEDLGGLLGIRLGLKENSMRYISTGILPERIRKELGLTIDQTEALLKANDTNKVTFPQFAKFLREGYANLVPF